MKKCLLSGVLLLSLMALANNSRAQGCSVCTKTAAGLDNKSAKGLNGGIVYLAFFPLVIMCSIGFIWWRSKSAE